MLIPFSHSLADYPGHAQGVDPVATDSDCASTHHYQAFPTARHRLAVAWRGLTKPEPGAHRRCMSRKGKPWSDRICRIRQKVYRLFGPAIGE